MDIKKLAKENMVLVAGIVLPMLLVIGFLVLAYVPKAMLTPPQYDFLVVGYRYDHNHIKNYHLNFEVREGAVNGRIIPSKEGSHNYHQRQHAVLFLYDSINQSFEEVSFDIPQGADSLEKEIYFPIAALEQMTFSKKQVSPDGYRFKYLGYRGRGGLLGEIFGMGRRYDSHYVLEKDGANYDLPYPVNHSHHYYGNNLSFVGWVVPTGVKP